MTLRAEQWAMVGVVGIGAVAAYLLTRARPRDLERIEFAPQQRVPPSSPLVQNILRPGAPGQPDHALLRRGDSVLGRLELGGSERAGDDATALRNLQLAGFSNVRLFSLADVVADPSLVPFPGALANASAISRWFFGTWSGNGTVAAGDVMMPREIVLLWPTTVSPPPRLAFASQPGL